MKFLLLASLGVFSFSSVAQDDFNAKKQHKLEYLDQKMEMLQETRTCIQGASNKDALKDCKEEMKAQKQEMKDQKKQWKKEKQEDSKQKQTEKQSESDESFSRSEQ
jgi:hypothetical protein